MAEALQFPEANKDGPYFLNLWFHEPHEPVAAAEEFLKVCPKEDNLDRRHYYGAVSQMDAAVGKLMKYLDDHKLRDNTIVFFTSNNGPETLKRYEGAERSYGSAGPLRGMNCTSPRRVTACRASSAGRAIRRQGRSLQNRFATSICCLPFAPSAEPSYPSAS